MDGIIKDGSKNVFHKLREIYTRCFEVRIMRKCTERIQTNQICNIVCAMLVQVNFVKLSSESNTLKVNTELNKH